MTGAGARGGPGPEPGPEEVRAALEASVRLQSHYAALLNQYDGGHRLSFADGRDWIERLRYVAAVERTGPGPGRD